MFWDGTEVSCPSVKPTPECLDLSFIEMEESLTGGLGRELGLSDCDTSQEEVATNGDNEPSYEREEGGGADCPSGFDELLEMVELEAGVVKLTFKEGREKEASSCAVLIKKNTA
jgi:hypothetical protein